MEVDQALAAPQGQEPKAAPRRAALDLQPQPKAAFEQRTRESKDPSPPDAKRSRTAAVGEKAAPIPPPDLPPPPDFRSGLSQTYQTWRNFAPPDFEILRQRAIDQGEGMIREGRVLEKRGEIAAAYDEYRQGMAKIMEAVTQLSVSDPVRASLLKKVANYVEHAEV